MTKVHQQSLLLGIFIGSAFVLILLMVILPSIEMNYPFEEAFSTTKNEFLSLKEHSSLTNESTINLNEKVRILCMVFTHEKNFKEWAYMVKQTWGAKCTKLLFMSNVTDSNNLIDVTVLDLVESRDTLWKKTKLSFNYAYQHHLYEFDWFLKADDDTYIIMENLRHYLYPYPSDLPLIFGFQFNTHFVSGGAGYILSREAVKIFIEKAIYDTEKCSQIDGGAEDAEIGHCLYNVANVTFGDTRDEFGKERFFPVSLQWLVNDKPADLKFWYWSSAEYYHNETGLECCSNTSIAFHYMKPVDMLTMEYLLYRFKVHEMEVKVKDLPVKFKKEDADVMFPRKNIGKKPKEK
ncbi:glycoprotein-N-acetylgalactosamine 3-beta-galactosyltransferase 1-like [Culicoides brevitarsis]|uniref:glycoprotein-N-acetylgalactosamine 3-beta-galactosyltransferase 1-like n=1 Tax=Culicoides brevitarsis TaxID=469753 RepID=UPI00307B8D09